SSDNRTALLGSLAWQPRLLSQDSAVQRVTAAFVGRTLEAVSWRPSGILAPRSRLRAKPIASETRTSSSQPRPFAKARLSARLPHAKSASKCVGIVARPAAGRHLFQFADVAAPDHNIGRLQRRIQSCNDVGDVLSPLLFAMQPQSPGTDIVLVRALLVGQMTELHRL